ncbi:MAG TPA: class I SAM-dependent methyltransferase [Actinomycetales bacterium]|nr:class I SAM-dependent methyltransferase [Actinomycetales bacterium]
MGVADDVARLADGGLPLRLTAWDGSRTGPPGSPITLHVANERALAALLTAPGDVGLARAYVSGDLELSGVHPGDPYEALRLVQDWRFALPPSALVDLARTAGVRRLLSRTRPEAEAEPRWRRAVRHHTRITDARTVRRHYDLSNPFYELVLGPSMTYSCAVFEKDDATLEEAQDAKHDLICRKLGLQPGMRLLDVGCGWGSMVRHAARHHGVEATGITLSPQQAEYARDAVRSEGLAGQVRILETDYRDVADGPYDAISSVGMIEHVGIRRYPRYFGILRDLLAPGGRLLNHGITRPDSHGSVKPGAFIDRYVFPDGELPPPGRVVTAAHDAGLEVRHVENLREHYAMTLREWGSNLAASWDDAVRLVGVERARVWGLYMAGSRLSFEQNALQVHQVLAVKPVAGVSGFPLRPDWA